LCIATASAQESSLRVVGAGTVQVPADTIIIAVSAQNNSNNLSLAEEANSKLLNLTEESLIAVGVKREEILPDRSKGYMTSHRVICNTVNNTTSCEDIITNVVTEQMVIRMKNSDANQTKAVVDAAKSAGAKASIKGYDLSDSSNAVDQARKKALDNAKAKAEYYASSFGFSLGKAIEIEESTYPDIEIGPIYGWDMPRRMGHMFWRESFLRMDRFLAGNHIPEGMAEVNAYVSVIYKV